MLETVPLGKQRSRADSKPPLLRTKTYVESLEWWFKDPRIATLAWVAYIAIYWTILAILPCILENNLIKYQYFLWIAGMIGVSSVYYAVESGHPADNVVGKPITAFTTAVISADWWAHCYSALSGDISTYDKVLMFCHSTSILWATLFFYNRAVQGKERLAWLTLLLEWGDLIMMCIVILIIHDEEGYCFNLPVCIAYFAVLGVDLITWFTPIMFGWSETKRQIHIHIIILDSLTDLPLVLTIIFSKAYKIHWIVFIDISFKIIMLVRSYAYHGFVGLCIHGKEERDERKQQLQQQQQNSNLR